MSARKTFVLFGLCVSAVASADWQYTRWGMTVDEVIEASGGLAKPHQEKPSADPARDAAIRNRAMLRAPYETGDFRFDADFMFSKSDERLAGVILRLNPASSIQCDRLEKSLKDVYGAPAERTRSSYGPMATWRDSTSGMRVLYWKIGESYCSVNYAPLTDRTKSGL